jgi:hypothetical protein
MLTRSRLLSSIILLCGATLLFCGRTAAIDSCLPCLAFDRLDKQIRDGALGRSEAESRFSRLIAELDALPDNATPGHTPPPWQFPLRGYTLTECGIAAAQGFVASGYDYFDGNRHGGHPSYDLFIHDRNQDSLDDRTEQPVTIVAVTGGIVVAAETTWDENSSLRGGKYLWIYNPAEQLLVYYAHNRDLLVTVGDRVEPGTPIATVGRSGLNAAKRRSPTHLHLTVLKIRNGRPTPENILSRLNMLISGR